MEDTWMTFKSRTLGEVECLHSRHRCYEEMLLSVELGPRLVALMARLFASEDIRIYFTDGTLSWSMI